MTGSDGLTVVVPTIGRWALLERALRSLPPGSLDVVVVADGVRPPRSVRRRIDALGARLLEHDVRRGLSAARNTGIRTAQGAWIHCLDDDDRVLPRGLRQLHAAARETAREAVLYGDGIVVRYGTLSIAPGKTERRIWRSPDFSWDVLGVRNPAPVGCYVHSRDAWERAGGFDERLEAIADWEYWIRLALRLPFRRVPVPVYEYHLGMAPGSMTLGGEEKFRRELCRVLEIHGAMLRSRVSGPAYDRLVRKSRGEIPVLMRA